MKSQKNLNNLHLLHRAFFISFAFIFSIETSYATEIDNVCDHAKLASLPITFAGKSLLPTIEGKVNEKTVTMLLDTGAGQTYLLPKLAEELKLLVGKPSSSAEGVSGTTSRSVTRPKSLEIGPMLAEKPYLFVINNLAFAPYFDVIAGADYLHAMDVEVIFSEKIVNFYQTANCVPAHYNTSNKNVSTVLFDKITEDNNRPIFMININGDLFRALIDTGASSSSIDTKAAARLGISPTSKGVARGNMIVGAGTSKIESWVTELAQVNIGKEIISNMKISIHHLANSGNSSPHEVLLGRDFLMTHRVQFSMAKNRIYIEKQH